MEAVLKELKTLFTGGDGDEKGRKGILKTIWNKVIEAIQEAACDYGPPYEYDEYFDGALLFETAQPNCKSSSVHTLLNCKVDPNDIDKDDLNFTPMHYCARFCHLAVMRMLVKAKAYVNVLNEFGQTPLIVCVMIKQSLNNTSTQLSMAEFLLDNGAYVDVRDKSGLSPLDYAAVHNNQELVSLLLDYGAAARRVNETFAVQRQTILDKTTDAECYTLINERLEEEEGELKYKRDQEAEKKRLEKEKKHKEWLREKHRADKEARHMKMQRNKAEKIRQEVREAKMKELAKKLAMEDALRKLQQHKMGSWERDEHHRWRWQDKKAFISTDHDFVYNESMKLVNSVRDKRSIKTLNKRWRAFTGDGQLEVTWKTLTTFDAIVDKDAKNKENNNAKEISDAFFKDVAPVLSFDYKDENDAELEGESLRELML